MFGLNIFLSHGFCRVFAFNSCFCGRSTSFLFKNVRSTKYFVYFLRCVWTDIRQLFPDLNECICISIWLEWALIEWSPFFQPLPVLYISCCFQLVVVVMNLVFQPSEENCVEAHHLWTPSDIYLLECLTPVLYYTHVCRMLRSLMWSSCLALCAPTSQPYSSWVMTGACCIDSLFLSVFVATSTFTLLQ